MASAAAPGDGAGWPSLWNGFPSPIQPWSLPYTEAGIRGRHVIL